MSRAASSRGSLKVGAGAGLFVERAPACLWASPWPCACPVRVHTCARRSPAQQPSPETQGAERLSLPKGSQSGSGPTPPCPQQGSCPRQIPSSQPRPRLTRGLLVPGKPRPCSCQCPRVSQDHMPTTLLGHWPKWGSNAFPALNMGLPSP